MLRSMIMLLLLARIKGEIPITEKGLSLQFGYRIACEKINLIHGVSIIECYRQCLNRGRCKSFNYLVRNKICVLCANDDSGGDISKYTGYALSQRKNWEQGLQESGCQCLDTEVCESQAANATCKIAECPKPVPPNQRAITYGNMYSVGNRLLFACPPNDLQIGDGKTTCQPDGHWTPTNMSCTAQSGTAYPDGFEDISGYMLKVVPYQEGQSLSYDQAQDACAVHSASLVRIDSPEKQTAIANHLLSGTTGYHWIQCRKDTSDGVWKFDDATPVPMTIDYWLPGRPYNNEGFDCGLMHSGENYYWSNYWCDYKLGYICEMK